MLMSNIIYLHAWLVYNQLQFFFLYFCFFIFIRRAVAETEAYDRCEGLQLFTRVHKRAYYRLSETPFCCIICDYSMYADGSLLRNVWNFLKFSYYISSHKRLVSVFYIGLLVFTLIQDTQKQQSRDEPSGNYPTNILFN